SRARARTPACCGSPMAGRSPSRSNRTTTPPPSSRIRGPPPGWAGSCATCSRWAPGRWRCSTACASVPWTRRVTVTCAPVWCAAFTGTLLLEASLELIASGHIVAIQDMGAAGLTSSSAEMAARGGVGVEVDLSRVPTREPGMTPYEILLSESQERMLVVAQADRVTEVQAIAAKWELTATPIGRVTDDGMYRATWQEQVVVEIPGKRLIDDCPVYCPEAREDEAIAELRRRDPGPGARAPDPAEALLT